MRAFLHSSLHLLSPLLLIAILSAALSGQTGSTLYTFAGYPDGAWPEGGVVVGPDGGAFYGPTQYGGANTFGSVFSVSQNSDGTWSESLVYSFTDVNDGAGPIGPITFDAAGNIYGTTAFGKPYGTVFKLTPTGNGYTPTLLYGFSGGADGQQPETGVTFDKAGNIYGTTFFGGIGYGVLYKLSPNADGSWSESVVHTFGSYSGDVVFPSTGVLIDAAGNLYGAANEGGANFKGAIYEFSPNSDGSWTENIIYSFTGKADGAVPNFLIMDKSGNLYGTAGGGGIQGTGCENGGCGTVFRLGRLSNGTWTFSRIYSFNVTTGEVPNHLTLDSAGNLYGTTLNGGPGDGTVFELKRNSTGQRWTYSTLYDFGTSTNNGIEPTGILINKDHLYGTTISTETCYLCGTVWEVTP